MAAFDLALSHLRDGCADCLSVDHINQLAVECKHRFRCRMLDPGNTLRLFVQQVSHGNVACSSMAHLSGRAFSDTAWCAARAVARGTD